MEQKISPEQFEQIKKEEIKEQFLMAVDRDREREIEKETEDINALLKQISDKELTPKQLNKLLREPGFHLLTLRDDSKEGSPIIAMASIFFRNTLSGLKGYIEDISVLKDYESKSKELKERMRKKFTEIATQRGAHIAV